MDLEIPRVNWPDDHESQYKVVQLEIDEEPYLRFGEKSWYNHGLILGTTLGKLEIKYELTRSSDGTYYVPALEGERYKVKGMGRAVMLTGNAVSFLDSNYDYELGINRDHMSAIKALDSSRDIIY